MFKKLHFFMLLFVCATQGIVQPKERSFVYPILDGVGKIADAFFARGNLSEKNQKLFDEVAQSLEIDYRGIQAKNMGLFFRLIGGYANAFALQQANRVYVNEDWLNELSEEQKRFLIAHELIHHRNHHVWKRIVVEWLIKNLAANAELNFARPDDNYLKKYFVTAPKQFVPGAFNYYNIFTLMSAQYAQFQETEADTHAVTVAGLDPESGVALMESLYHQDATNWPLYGKAHAALNSVLLPLLSLPFIKQHVQHLASFDERVAHLRSLRAEWLEKQKNKEKPVVVA